MAVGGSRDVVKAAGGHWPPASVSKRNDARRRELAPTGVLGNGSFASRHCQPDNPYPERKRAAFVGDSMRPTDADTGKKPVPPCRLLLRHVWMADMMRPFEFAKKLRFGTEIQLEADERLVCVMG